jgi:predicted phage tail protein
MTEVRIHGYLSKFFDSKIKLHLGRLNDVFRALSAIKAGFREKVMELQNKGYYYTTSIVDNVINIIPCITGFGKVLRIILAVVLIIVAIIIIIVTGGMGFWAMTLLSTAVSLLMYKDPKLPSFNQTRVNTGGAVLEGGSKGQSYIFSNNQNVASQGNLVPIGYGSFLLNSKIINVSVKNYPTSQSFMSESELFASDSSFSFI